MTNPYDRAEQRPASRLDPDPLISWTPCVECDDLTPAADLDQGVCITCWEARAWRANAAAMQYRPAPRPTFWIVVSALVVLASIAVIALLLAAPRAAPDRDASASTQVGQGQPGASLAWVAQSAEHRPADRRGGGRGFEPRPGPSDVPITVIGPPLTVVYGDVPDTATRVIGSATWYCSTRSACTRGYPASGMFAAAGSELRAWKGRFVRVRSGTRSVTVRLVDVCACPGPRIIDLYASAFRRLAPLSRGVIRVTVEPERALLVPPTSTR